MSQQRLLIVDDSMVSRMRIRMFFASACPDWEIFELSSGDEAVNKAHSLQPTHITMDVNMPGINGFTATAQIEFVAKPPTEASLTDVLTLFNQGV